MTEIPIDVAADPSTPLPHDGWKSRKVTVGCVAALLVFLLATVMTVWSGHFSETAWFEADYWVKSVWVSAAVLGFAFGLLTAEKVLELVRLVLPAIGVILQARGK